MCGAKRNRGVRQLSDAALIEKWLGCSPTAGTSLSQRWSRSGCQLHTPYTCIEPGQCRRSNRHSSGRSALSRIVLVGGVYVTVSTGGLVLSRVSNRFDVGLVDSSPNNSQPKLLAGLFSHDCTSATICAEVHVYCPMPPTDTLALTVPEKSPPCVVQKIVS